MLPRSRRHLGRRGTAPTVCLSLAAVAVLLVSGIPLAPAVSKAGAVRTPAAGAGPTAPSSPSPPENTSALCLLGVGLNCPTTTGASLSIPASSGDPSSWTNITPAAGSANPEERYLAAATYYPAGHEDLLFGGYVVQPVRRMVYYQDTWTFADGSWTLAVNNASCTPTTCPSPRSGAFITYFPPENAVVLFGGYRYNGLEGVAYNDTWLFYNDSWHNVTATAGSAPSPRFEGTLQWDGSDGYALLFGGSTAAGTSLGDTWSFNGTWKNLSSSVGEYTPAPRAGAAIAASPSGYLMLYGGEDDGTVLTDSDQPCVSTVAWWFHDGGWIQMGDTPACIQGPVGVPLAGSENNSGPPCGRVGAALGWSPQNERFVLFGGYGYLVQDGSCSSVEGGSGDLGYLNDTWSYLNAPGNGFAWGNATDNGDPSPREWSAYATDYTDDYFEVFGGLGPSTTLNDTWRFYELVHARLSGASTIDSSPGAYIAPVDATGYGGSGDLEYRFAIEGLKTGHTLSGTGCAPLTDGGARAVPADSTAEIVCNATEASYNLYRLTLHVWDVENLADNATANWSLTVTPPEAFAIYSQYKGSFYSSISFDDKFGFLAEVSGQPATALNFTVDDQTYYPTERTSAPNWWDFSLDVSQLEPGPNVFQAVAEFGDNWNLTANYTVNLIDLPYWAESVIHFPSVSQTITPKGTGPYNESYSIAESWSWSLNQPLSLVVPIPFVKGNYSLVPSLQVTLGLTSSGNVSLGGAVGLALPKINLGPVNLVFSAAFTLKGSFTLGIEQGQIETIDWLSANAQLSVTGSLSVDLLSYGVNILGVKLGFTLTATIAPSIAIGMVLAPTTDSSKDFISGIAIEIEQFFATFKLPLTLAANFSIGFASVSLSGQVALALQFELNPGISLEAGWINGSVTAKASALFWSDTWNILSGTIYQWTDPPDGTAAAAPDGAGGPAYDNGTDSSWVLQGQYYSGSGYDENVWATGGSTGPAVTDIYPETEVTAASFANGTDLFFGNDNLGVAIQQGLEVSALALSDTTNALSGLTGPSDPGFDLTDPEATTLPNGRVYVLWQALPTAESSLAGPTDVQQLELQGALYDPSTAAWGPVQTWSRSGIVESDVVDATGGATEAAALVSTTFLVGESSPEQLLVYNLTSGALLANWSVTGLARLVSLRGASGYAVVEDVGGNFSLLSLASGDLAPLDPSAPADTNLTSAEFLEGSASTLVLLYRGTNSSTLLLRNVSSGTVDGSLALSGEVTEAEGIAQGTSAYVFVRGPGGVLGWTESAGKFTALANLSWPDLTGYGLAQDGSGILVYGLTTNGNATEPIVTLDLAEVGADLAPVPGPTAAAAHGASPSSAYALVLGIGGAAVALLLGVTAFPRRRPPSSGGLASPPSEAPSSSSISSTAAPADRPGSGGVG